MEYLPTFAIDLSPSWIGKYTYRPMENTEKSDLTKNPWQLPKLQQNCPQDIGVLDIRNVPTEVNQCSDAQWHCWWVPEIRLTSWGW